MSVKSSTDIQQWFKDLPLSNPKCNNDSCFAFQAAHNASQASVSYALQFEYGHWTTWYYLGIIGVFATRYIWMRLQPSSQRQNRAKPMLIDRSRAVARLFTYRRLKGKIPDRWPLPSYGVMVLCSFTVIIAAIATFAIQPYYREHRGFGSPPIAVRTGLMAVACTPLLVALSGKANIITLLTGIGHEKLNVIHRFVGWLVLILSIIHTIPFLIAPLRDGGPAALRAQFYRPGALEYSGTPPMVVLFVIVLLSIRWTRDRMYEAFWHIHIILALLYIALMFWHANQELDSWAYLWATLGIVFASTLARVFLYTRAFNIREEWFRPTTARIESLPGDLTRITLIPPPGFNWSPAQHCYVRFPSIRPWDNHPFTIASAQHIEAQNGELLFLIRMRGGLTQALHRWASSSPDESLSILLDGPYGGIRDSFGNAFSQIILVAGGVGISACLPWMEYFASHIKNDSTAPEVTLVWMIKHKTHISWVHLELEAVTEKNRTHAHLFVTQEASEPVPFSAEEDSREKVADKTRESKNFIAEFNTSYTRPNLGELIPSLWTQESAFVLACGPDSLKIDASNACAIAQRRIIAGGARELRFHSETFGW